MENFPSPFAPFTATFSTSSSPSSTQASSSSQLYHYPAAQYLPQHPYWQLWQQSFLTYPPTMCPFPVLLPQPSLDEHASMAAREASRMARQRRRLILTAQKAACSAAASSRMAVGRDDATGAGVGPEMPNRGQGLYTFCALDNKRLKFLFKKVLKNSDVGSLGRIVLPKKEAETYLPSLSDREGRALVIRDTHSNQEWGLKYKYWINNNSRMYVLESTGDFVRQTGVQVGDIIHLYEDECKNLYISIQKPSGSGPIHAKPSSYRQPNRRTRHDEATAAINNTNNKTANQDNLMNQETIWRCNTYNELAGTEVVESASPVLLHQHKEQLLEGNDMVTLFSDQASSPAQREEASYSNDDVTTELQTFIHPAVAAELETSSLSSQTVVKTTDNFDDCYKGLGTLPEFDRFELSDFDYI